MSATALSAFIARCRVRCQPRSQVSDAELLRRFTQQRDADAFAQLLERYASLVWSVCRRILMRESDCEDAFQAVFLALVRRPEAIDPNPSLGAWLHTVSIRVARRTLTQSRRQQLSPRVPEKATGGDVADDVSSRELLRLVDEEIEQLPMAVRAPLILCCLEGRTRDEAAEVLGCSVAAVKSRLERGRGLLRKRLAQRGVQLPAAFLVLGLTNNRLSAAVWAKTMQSALHTPSPSVAALAQAALPTLSTSAKCKLILAAVLLTLGAVGAIGHVLSVRLPETPATMTPALAATEPKEPEAPQIRTDRHGDPLPDGALARLGTVRWRHGEFVHALAYSADGKKIATTGVGRALVLWDADTGKELRVFPSRGQPRAVAFSPNGKWIATDQRLGQVWDADTGKMLWEQNNVQIKAHAVAFSPDGKSLAMAHSDGSVQWLDATTGAAKRRIETKQGYVYVVVYSPDGATLATGHDGTICLWEAATGNERRRISTPKIAVTSVAFSPDGKYLAAGGNEHAVRLWSAATGEVIRTFGDKQKGNCPVAFSPDGNLLAAGYDDDTFRLWDVASGEEKRCLHAGAGTRRTRSLAFSPDGKTLATAVFWDGGIRLWDVATGRERNASDAHHGPIKLLRFGADKGTLISAGIDRRLIWWDVPTQTPRREFTWSTDSFSGIALSPDGNLLAVGDHKTHELWLWDIRTGKSTKLPWIHKSYIETIAFSPDGRLVASGSGRDAIHVWDVREGKEVHQLTGIGNQNGARVLFTPDGKTLACGTLSFGGEVSLHLWDVASGKERQVFDNKGAGISPDAFSPDGKVLASAHNPSGQEAFVRLFDMTTGKELSRHGGHRSSIGGVAFSPDGKLVVSGGSDDTEDNSIHVWEAATGRLIRRFEGHHSWVWAVTFAADGLTVASGAGDSTILVWDITGRRSDGRWHAKPLTPRELESCWIAVANGDAAKAYDAVWALVAAPEQAVPFLRKHLSPVPRPDAQVVARLIADIDNDDFQVRQKAVEELGKFGDAIAPALQRTLEGKPSLEVKRRIQQLLDQARDWTPERLRVHRTIQALEHIGTPQAKEVLHLLAEGTPQCQRTTEALAALQRLEHARASRKY